MSYTGEARESNTVNTTQYSRILHGRSRSGTPSSVSSTAVAGHTDRHQLVGGCVGRCSSFREERSHRLGSLYVCGLRMNSVAGNQSSVASWLTTRASCCSEIQAGENLGGCQAGKEELVVPGLHPQANTQASLQNIRQQHHHHSPQRSRRQAMGASFCCSCCFQCFLFARLTS